ncbi:MAG: response regulator transcription factor [Smithellaceae bacterium]|nr:response regulator transcription factor [Smithellaceae bacterium]
MTVRVLLVDDHKIMRQGLRNLIDAQEDMEVAGEADNGRKAVEMAKKLRPNVVVMDISMPDMNGIEATQKIKQELPEVKVIALSMHSDSRFVMKMIKAGAAGYLLKDCAFDELIVAIKATLSHHTYLSSAITDVVVRAVKNREQGEEEAQTTDLTQREREIVQLLAEGMSTKEIAYHLHLSAKTVETHRLNILNKLKISSIAELTKYAIREGITTVEGRIPKVE